MPTARRDHLGARKVAISIPEGLFRDGERAAKQLGMSRSRLYCEAMRRFLDRGRRSESREEIKRRINEVCKDVDTSLDPVLRNLVVRSLRSEEP